MNSLADPYAPFSEPDGSAVRRDIVLLGSTGSIGTQTIDVVKANPDLFRVVGLSAGGGRVDVDHQEVDFGVARE